MKIPGHSHRARVGTRADGPTAPSEGAREATRAGAPAAQVQVSRTARAFEDLRAPEQPDAAKVERLRAAIARGELAIDFDKIAERMLEEER